MPYRPLSPLDEWSSRTCLKHKQPICAIRRCEPKPENPMPSKRKKKKSNALRSKQTKASPRPSRSRVRGAKKVALVNKGTPLTYEKIKTLVASNSKSAGLSNECVIAVCWKESSFDPSAQS